MRPLQPAALHHGTGCHRIAADAVAKPGFIVGVYGRVFGRLTEAGTILQVRSLFANI